MVEVEEWRDIPGYEGIYQASSEGNIRSLDRYTKYGNDSLRFSPGRVLSKSINRSNGYYEVCLSVDSVAKRYLVHRLIASTFLDNCEGLPTVDHVNGNKTDNRVENLRWCSYKENTAFAIDNGLIDLNKCAKHLESDKCVRERLKKTRSVVRRSDGIVFGSVREAAEATGCSRQLVSRNLIGLCKTAKGYTFEYVKKSEASQKNVRRGIAPRKVAQIDPCTGDIVKVFDSAKDVAATLGNRGIFSYLAGGRKLCAGYQWKYVD